MHVTNKNYIFILQNYDYKSFIFLIFLKSQAKKVTINLHNYDHKA